VHCKIDYERLGTLEEMQNSDSTMESFNSNMKLDRQGSEPDRFTKPTAHHLRVIVSLPRFQTLPKDAIDKPDSSTEEEIAR